MPQELKTLRISRHYEAGTDTYAQDNVFQDQINRFLEVNYFVWLTAMVFLPMSKGITLFFDSGSEQAVRSGSKSYSYDLRTYLFYQLTK